MKTPPTPPASGKKPANRFFKAFMGKIIKWTLVLLAIIILAVIGTGWVLGKIETDNAIKTLEAERRIKTAADAAEKPVNPPGGVDKPTNPPIANADKGTPTEEEAGKEEAPVVDIGKLKEELLEQLKKDLPAVATVPAEPAPAAPSAPVVETDPDRVKLAEDMEKELKSLRAEKDNFEKTAREKAEALVAAEREKLQKDAEETFPGEARLVVKDFDPEKQVPKKDDRNVENKEFRGEGEEITFAVSKTARYPRVRIDGQEKTTEVYPVLAPDGRPLTMGSTPKIKGGTNPFRVEIYTPNGWQKIWCATPE